MADAGKVASEARMEETRRQVDEVQNIMKGNVEKILERDGKLGVLEERADRLQEGTEQFHRSAIRVKRKQWWENMKMKIIIGVTVSVAVIIILVIIFSS